MRTSSIVFACTFLFGLATALPQRGGRNDWQPEPTPATAAVPAPAPAPIDSEVPAVEQPAPAQVDNNAVTPAAGGQSLTIEITNRCAHEMKPIIMHNSQVDRIGDFIAPGASAPAFVAPDKAGYSGLRVWGHAQGSKCQEPDGGGCGIVECTMGGNFEQCNLSIIGGIEEPIAFEWPCPAAGREPVISVSCTSLTCGTAWTKGDGPNGEVCPPRPGGATGSGSDCLYDCTHPGAQNLKVFFC